MNGKATKRIRAIAKQKAHSWKETTTQGSKMRKMGMDSILTDSRYINIKDGVFFQRLLHHMSVGSIAKKLKNLLKNTPRHERFETYGVFSQLINKNPELLGIKA